MSTKEQWRECCDGWYEVSDRGRVRRAKPGPGARVGKILKPGTGTKGYLHVGLYCEGKGKIHSVHRLVALAFNGPCPDGKEVNHKDGDKTNNTANNLEYATGKENMRHAMRTGLMRYRIPQATVDRVRYLRSTGMPYAKIAKETGVSNHYCRDLVLNKFRTIPL